jgi:hypothetical protein
MQVITKEGEAIFLPDSTFLADMLSAGSGVPDKQVPEQFEAAPDVDPERLRRLAETVLHNTH